MVPGTTRVKRSVLSRVMALEHGTRGVHEVGKPADGAMLVQLGLTFKLRGAPLNRKCKDWSERSIQP
jgi:hypothetical protein